MDCGVKQEEECYKRIDAEIDITFKVLAWSVMLESSWEEVSRRSTELVRTGTMIDMTKLDFYEIAEC